MLRNSLLLVLCATASTALAQSTLVAPNGFATTIGNSNNIYPWGRGTASMRYQQIYDSSHFTAQGATFPVLIQGIRFRPYPGAVTSWTGGTWNNIQIDLASSPNDYLGASATFTSNLGPDVTTVLNGPVTMSAGSTLGTGVVVPSHIDIPFSTPFLYDPNAADLTLDIHLDGAGWTGTYRACDAVSTAAQNTKCTRIYDTGGLTSPTGTVGTEYGLVTEFVYVPAAGLHASFSANVTSGPSPLAVNFTDLSYSSDPGGVVAWAWDFDGDNVIDSNLRNPSHVYPNCGTFNVSLTVFDATNPPSTLTRSAFITTDTITADFTSALLVGPNIFQFTDTTTPAATAWDWDFNGDNITDSTAQNPVWPMNLCAASNVRLIATRSCQTSTKTRTVFLSPALLTTTYTSTNGGATGYGVFLDINVTNPAGISVCGMDHNISSAVGTPFSVNVYVTPGTYVGADTNGSLWRLVGTGSGNSAGTGIACTTPMNSPFYLPAGSYGMAIYYTGASMRYEGTNAVPPVQNTFSNADLTLTGGIVHTTLWGGTLFTPRLWNGGIHYDTTSLSGTAGYGFFGAGCAGSLGISNQVAANRPQLGATLNVTLTNLPLSGAVMMMGLSRSASPFGPLPLDITVFGAPGCSARVSPDATLFVFGANNSAPWSLGIPNGPGLIGQLFYTQAFALDPGFNALGAVLGDAYALQIGN